MTLVKPKMVRSVHLESVVDNRVEIYCDKAVANELKEFGYVVNTQMGGGDCYALYIDKRFDILEVVEYIRRMACTSN